MAGNGEVSVGTGECNAGNPTEDRRNAHGRAPVYSKTDILYSLEGESNDSTSVMTVVKSDGKSTDTITITITITFKNESSLPVDGSIKDSEGNSVYAQISVKNPTNDSSAIGINLDAGTNLNIDATNKFGDAKSGNII
jgi:hypothetical protein